MSTEPKNALTTAYPSLGDLVEQWYAARMRTFLARQRNQGTAQSADYWAELTLATTIASEVVSGRWCAVADLLRLGAVESWAQVGDAMGISETDAADGFRQWITGQAGLHSGSVRLGLDTAQAEALHALADAVAL